MIQNQIEAHSQSEDQIVPDVIDLTELEGNLITTKSYFLE